MIIAFQGGSMFRLLGLVCLLASSVVMAAGSTTISRKAYQNTEVVTISWTGDASDGSVPVRQVGLFGYVEKVVINPGDTAPTANYDISFQDPADSNLDVFATALHNLSATTTAQIFPRIAGTVGTVSSFANLLIGEYGFYLHNNSVASATGVVQVYLKKP